MKLLCAAALLCAALPALAAETRLECLSAGPSRTVLDVPKVVFTDFDEDATTASIFATEYGGRVQGSDVRISRDTIFFKVTLPSGEPADVLIHREIGDMFVQIKGVVPGSYLSKCRKRVNRF